MNTNNASRHCSSPLSLKFIYLKFSLEILFKAVEINNSFEFQLECLELDIHKNC